MDVVTLITLVIINCTTAQSDRKSEEICIVVSVAERFVGLWDFTEGIVAMNAPSSQAQEPV